ncbi:MAG TPA: hypothetical protein DIS74_06255 [Bacteroidales bacterium]|nr:hypothetical protein [Bacteroidales bacterium]
MTISVIIPAYNSGATIARALESVFMQSRPADEIMVVDDGSTDSTPEVIMKFPEVRYIFQTNQGPAAARNNGVKAAKGDYIAFLDSDDYWEAGHLKNLASLLGNNTELHWAATAYRKHLLNGREKTVRLQARHYSDGNRVDYFSATPELHFLSVISTAVSRELFIEAGGFAERYSRGEDLSLWLRLALAEPVLGYSPEPTAVYVETTQSLTGRRGNLSALAQRITDDWTDVCSHSPEAVIRAWPVVKPWVAGLLIKSIRAGDRATMEMIDGVFSDRLVLWQKTAITICRWTAGRR